MSVDLLAAAGYQVVASTGKPDKADRTRWAAAVDCVGGATLAEARIVGGALNPRHLDEVTHEVDVKDVVGVLDEVRAGRYSGRAVVKVAGGF